jgi:hypothetical protein
MRPSPETIVWAKPALLPLEETLLFEPGCAAGAPTAGVLSDAPVLVLANGA